MMGWTRWATAVAVVALLSACGSDKSGPGTGPSAAPTAAAPTPGERPVVIELGPNGQTRVEGGEVKGDPRTCSEMKACCATSSDVSLFCGLSQATQGATCASVLESTRKYLAERKIARPAGCP